MANVQGGLEFSYKAETEQLVPILMIINRVFLINWFFAWESGLLPTVMWQDTFKNLCFLKWNTRVKTALLDYGYQMVHCNLQVLAKLRSCSICSQNLEGCSLAHAHKIFVTARTLGFWITHNLVNHTLYIFWREIHISVSFQWAELEIPRRSYSVYTTKTNNEINLRKWKRTAVGGKLLQSTAAFQLYALKCSLIARRISSLIG